MARRWGITDTVIGDSDCSLDVVSTSMPLRSNLWEDEETLTCHHVQKPLVIILLYCYSSENIKHACNHWRDCSVRDGKLNHEIQGHISPAWFLHGRPAFEVDLQVSMYSKTPQSLALSIDNNWLRHCSRPSLENHLYVPNSCVAVLTKKK